MTAFPEHICKALHLRLIELGSNKIPTLPPAIGALRRLAKLGLRGNTIESLPPELSLAKRLCYIDLQGNPLSISPACAVRGDHEELRRFLAALLGAVTKGIGKFGGQMLGGVPLQVAGVSGMVELDLSSNGIELLPRQLGKLQLLQVLDVRDNRLTDVPVELSACSSLHSLHLDRNNFTEVPNHLSPFVLSHSLLCFPLRPVCSVSEPLLVAGRLWRTCARCSSCRC